MIKVYDCTVKFEDQIKDFPSEIHIGIEAETRGRAKSIFFSLAKGRVKFINIRACLDKTAKPISASL